MEGGLHRGRGGRAGAERGRPGGPDRGFQSQCLQGAEAVPYALLERSDHVSNSRLVAIGVGLVRLVAESANAICV